MVVHHTPHASSLHWRKLGTMQLPPTLTEAQLAVPRNFGFWTQDITTGPSIHLYLVMHRSRSGLSCQDAAPSLFALPQQLTNSLASASWPLAEQI